MTTKKRASAKKTKSSSNSFKRGLAAMSNLKAMSSLKYAVTTIVVVCAVILIVLTALGPKVGLQTPPIEPKAMEYLEKMNFIKPGEKIEGYKATSYYSYNSGVVVTNKRIFAFYRNKEITSIPLNKITVVLVKDTELGHQEVLISAQYDGVIALDLHHGDVNKFIEMLKVPATMVKHYTKHDIREALTVHPSKATTATPAKQ